MCFLPERNKEAYLDKLDQIFQGHFLLTAAPTLKEEVIPQGVFLSCDLSIDTTHTATHTQMHSKLTDKGRLACEGCWTLKDRAIRQLRTISNSQVKKVLPPI